MSGYITYPDGATTVQTGSGSWRVGFELKNYARSLSDLVG
jgi:hypothetical protein